MLDEEEYNVFRRIGPACLLCLVSGYSVTVQRRPAWLGMPPAPPPHRGRRGRGRRLGKSAHLAKMSL